MASKTMPETCTSISRNISTASNAPTPPSLRATRSPGAILDAHIAPAGPAIGRHRSTNPCSSLRAKRSNPSRVWNMDCFVAPLLATTGVECGLYKKGSDRIAGIAVKACSLPVTAAVSEATECSRTCSVDLNKATRPICPARSIRPSFSTSRLRSQSCC